MRHVLTFSLVQSCPSERHISTFVSVLLLLHQLKIGKHATNVVFHATNEAHSIWMALLGYHMEHWLFKSSDKRCTGKVSESTAIEITCHDHSMLYWDARDFILSQLAQIFICGDYRAEPCNGPSAITTNNWRKQQKYVCNLMTHDVFTFYLNKKVFFLVCSLA